MLVISRKLNERLVVGENIEITILDIEDGRIKLGIEAPKTIKIIRGELLTAIRSENQEASEGSSAKWIKLLQRFVFEQKETASKEGQK